jgi:hemoglobin
MRIRALLAIVLLSAACGSKKPTPAPTPSPGPAPDPGPVAKNDTPAPKPTAPATKSLFDRLGGLPAITAVVEEFVGRTTTDDRIKERFFNTDATNLKKLLVEFVCVATGGPCKYSGRSMEDSHAGMDLVDDEFGALVEDLVAALDKFKVPEKEKGELLTIAGSLKADIVEKP